MQDNTSLTLSTEVQTGLKSSVAAAEQYFAAMVKSAEACKSVLAPITKDIATKEEDEAIAGTLGQVKAAMDKVQQRRKEITAPLDELKKNLMEPEKAIQGEYDRVVLMRNAWATKESNRIKEEQAAIQRKKNAELEVIKVKDDISAAIEMYIEKTANAVDGKLIDFFSRMTMENFEEASKVVKTIPALKQEAYEAFFVAPAAINATQAEVNDAVALMRTLKPYADVNDAYKLKLSTKFSPWILLLPSRKKELEQLAALSATNADAAANLEAAQKAASAKAAEEAALAAKAAEEDKAVELAKQAQANQIGAEFAAQIQSQGVGEQSGIRKNRRAVIKCEEKDMLVVLTELLYVCVTHPKHEGIYKKEKSGEFKMEDGEKVYADWLQGFLTFYAVNCEPSIAGITILDKVTAVTKKAVK